MTKNLSSQKTVLLGITGCIAAYKSAEIVRLLQKAGLRVKVVMTEHATQFVGPLTFRSLTHEPVAVGLFDNPQDPIHHISLVEEADLFLIAPCTANVIAKIASGIADDLLCTTALATTAPLMVAPAMNLHMYEADATRSNFDILRARGIHILEADAGYLACGDIGPGRLPEPEVIVARVTELLDYKRDLVGKRVMVTAGPTEEMIDPVRFLSNNSSGKMGYALAREASMRGAEVTLISGPVSLCASSDVNLVKVRSAQDMFEAARKVFPTADLAIFSAAVCDMRPKFISDHKLKKSSDSSVLSYIECGETPDILAHLAANKRSNQVVIGFAAETCNVIENGHEKLKRKQADIIVANEVGEGKVFGSNLNKAYIIDSQKTQELPEITKTELAKVILDDAIELLKRT